VCLLATVAAQLRWRETGLRVWWRLACGSLAAMLAMKNEGALRASAILLPVAMWSRLARVGEGVRQSIGNGSSDARRTCRS